MSFTTTGTVTVTKTAIVIYYVKMFECYVHNCMPVSCVWCIENKWLSIDVIYYEYGSLVLVFNNIERASRAFTILQDATFDNKQLLVLLLPNIQVFAAETAAPTRYRCRCCEVVPSTRLHN